MADLSKVASVGETARRLPAAQEAREVARWQSAAKCWQNMGLQQ